MLNTIMIYVIIDVVPKLIVMARFRKLSVLASGRWMECNCMNCILAIYLLVVETEYYVRALSIYIHRDI